MTAESQSNGPSQIELARWIQVSGESDFVDAKGPMFWDGADSSASLAKDIISFANSRDGGVLVIGKSESNDGSFVYDGLTPDQAASFDTTKVGQWVNSRFAPPVRLVCYQADLSGKRFVVITVQEFTDVPSLCVKSFQDSTNPKNHILRQGTIYVRNQNAESKPITTVDELRGLIGLATRKKGDELIAHFNAMLKGQPLAALGRSVPDPYERELQQVRTELNLDVEKSGWWLTFRPATYSADRWASIGELEDLISRHSVRIYDEFPGHSKGTFGMGWGIANDLYGETWALTKSGMFCFSQEFRENREPASHSSYRGMNDAQHLVPPGEWIEYTWAIRTLVDFFMFQARFVGAYPPGEEVRICFKVGPLLGRKLVAINYYIIMGYGDPEPCRSPYFTFDRTFDSEALRTGWERVCAEVLQQFIELFPRIRIDIETLLRWIEKCKVRQL